MFVRDTDLNDEVRRFLCLFNLYKYKYAMIQWLNVICFDSTKVSILQYICKDLQMYLHFLPWYYITVTYRRHSCFQCPSGADGEVSDEGSPVHSYTEAHIWLQLPVRGDNAGWPHVSTHYAVTTGPGMDCGIYDCKPSHNLIVQYLLILMPF